MKIEDIEYKVDGTLVWKRTKGRAIKGSVVGHKSYYGYMESQVDGKRFKNHHLVWFLHYGYFPVMLDHINGVRDDNRIENLRECTTASNSRNRHTLKERSLPRNVYYSNVKSKPYRVALSIDSKYVSKGYYATLEEAVKVSEQARKDVYGEFRGKEHSKASRTGAVGKRVSSVDQENFTS